MHDFLPKQVDESKQLDKDANDGPLDKDEENASKEADRSTDLLATGEKVYRLLGPDHQCESCQE